MEQEKGKDEVEDWGRMGVRIGVGVVVDSVGARIGYAIEISANQYKLPARPTIEVEIPYSLLLLCQASHTRFDLIWFIFVSVSSIIDNGNVRLTYSVERQQV